MDSNEKDTLPYNPALGSKKIGQNKAPQCYIPPKIITASQSVNDPSKENSAAVSDSSYVQLATSNMIYDMQNMPRESSGNKSLQRPLVNFADEVLTRQSNSTQIENVLQSQQLKQSIMGNYQSRQPTTEQETHYQSSGRYESSARNFSNKQYNTDSSSGAPSERLLSPKTFAQQILQKTAKVIDASRVVSDENKDAQTELEVGHLKLDSLTRKIDECLANSKKAIIMSSRVTDRASRSLTPSAREVISMRSSKYGSPSKDSERSSEREKFNKIASEKKNSPERLARFVEQRAKVSEVTDLIQENVNSIQQRDTQTPQTTGKQMTDYDVSTNRSIQEPPPKVSNPKVDVPALQNFNDRITPTLMGSDIGSFSKSSHRIAVFEKPQSPTRPISTEFIQHSEYRNLLEEEMIYPENSMSSKMQTPRRSIITITKKNQDQSDVRSTHSTPKLGKSTDRDSFPASAQKDRGVDLQKYCANSQILTTSQYGRLDTPNSNLTRQTPNSQMSILNQYNNNISPIKPQNEINVYSRQPIEKAISPADLSDENPIIFNPSSKPNEIENDSQSFLSQENANKKFFVDVGDASYLDKSSKTYSPASQYNINNNSNNRAGITFSFDEQKAGNNKNEMPTKSQFKIKAPAVKNQEDRSPTPDEVSLKDYVVIPRQGDSGPDHNVAAINKMIETPGTSTPSKYVDPRSVPYNTPNDIRKASGYDPNQAQPQTSYSPIINPTEIINRKSAPAGSRMFGSQKWGNPVTNHPAVATMVESSKVSPIKSKGATPQKVKSPERPKSMQFTANTKQSTTQSPYKANSPQIIKAKLGSSPASTQKVKSPSKDFTKPGGHQDDLPTQRDIKPFMGSATKQYMNEERKSPSGMKFPKSNEIVMMVGTSTPRNRHETPKPQDEPERPLQTMHKTTASTYPKDSEFESLHPLQSSSQREMERMLFEKLGDESKEFLNLEQDILGYGSISPNESKTMSFEGGILQKLSGSRSEKELGYYSRDSNMRSKSMNKFSRKSYNQNLSRDDTQRSCRKSKQLDSSTTLTDDDIRASFAKIYTSKKNKLVNEAESFEERVSTDLFYRRKMQLDYEQFMNENKKKLTKKEAEALYDRLAEEGRKRNLRDYKVMMEKDREFNESKRFATPEQKDKIFEKLIEDSKRREHWILQKEMMKQIENEQEIEKPEEKPKMSKVMSEKLISRLMTDAKRRQVQKETEAKQTQEKEAKEAKKLANKKYANSTNAKSKLATYLAKVPETRNSESPSASHKPTNHDEHATNLSEERLDTYENIRQQEESIQKILQGKSREQSPNSNKFGSKRSSKSPQTNKKKSVSKEIAQLGATTAFERSAAEITKKLAKSASKPTLSSTKVNTNASSKKSLKTSKSKPDLQSTSTRSNSKEQPNRAKNFLKSSSRTNLKPTHANGNGPIVLEITKGELRSAEVRTDMFTSPKSQISDFEEHYKTKSPNPNTRSSKLSKSSSKGKLHGSTTSSTSKLTTKKGPPPPLSSTDSKASPRIPPQAAAQKRPPAHIIKSGFGSPQYEKLQQKTEFETFAEDCGIDDDYFKDAIASDEARMKEIDQMLSKIPMRLNFGELSSVAHEMNDTESQLNPMELQRQTTENIRSDRQNHGQQQQQQQGQTLQHSLQYLQDLRGHIQQYYDNISSNIHNLESNILLSMRDELSSRSKNENTNQLSNLASQQENLHYESEFQNANGSTQPTFRAKSNATSAKSTFRNTTQQQPSNRLTQTPSIDERKSAQVGSAAKRTAKTPIQNRKSATTTATTKAAGPKKSAFGTSAANTRAQTPNMKINPSREPNHNRVDLNSLVSPPSKGKQGGINLGQSATKTPLRNRGTPSNQAASNTSVNMSNYGSLTQKSSANSSNIKNYLNDNDAKKFVEGLLSKYKKPAGRG